LWARYERGPGKSTLQFFEGRYESVPVYVVAFAEWLLDRQAELKSLEDAYEAYKETGEAQHIEK
jgi:hypothetical protein